MNSIIPTPVFDDNTHLHTLKPSHKAIEAEYIYETVNPNKRLGIVSMGHDGIEMAKIDSDIQVYMPTETPKKIYEKTKKLTNNVTRVGKNYPDCYETAEGIIRNNEDMLNISTGMINKHIAYEGLLDSKIQSFDPDYIFIADSNMDFTVGILESLEKSEINGITVVACILPDHFNLSPRFNKIYRHKHFFTGMSFMGFASPGLNRSYKLYNNIALKTVVSPEYCHSKYSPAYPNLDPMNFLPMEVSTKFNTESRKLVILSGENLLL